MDSSEVRALGYTMLSEAFNPPINGREVGDKLLDEAFRLGTLSVELDRG